MVFHAMDDLNLPTVIPVDENYGRFSVLEEEDRDASSAYSMASSAYNFRMENGRRYHDYKDGHPFPHDEVSEENEITMHEMCLLIFEDKYFLSPVDESNLRAVADIGTGRGYWAEGVADRFPDAQVVGMDLTPHARNILPNCSFMLADATEDWVLDDPSMKFDLVHIRSLFGGVRDWAALYKNCFDNMRSGGWIEQLEIEIDAQTQDASTPPDSHIKALCEYTRSHLSVAAGRDFDISFSMKQMIEDAGFVDVQEKRINIPLGPWSSDSRMKDIGRFYERFYKTGLQGWLLQVCTRQLNWSVDQVNAACVSAFKEINQRQQHWYYPLVIVIGRKP
ncbi:hypothetical protein, variant [Exophiala oligosperma]|uniref:Methyltransferase domain-containing protein n=1 Tax=Exophiala oligosperma TaxID=215243 RepID=A0A0D2C2F0_9EURO|nr:hypothetical protein, variant [Exophiala oligosperma]KIW43922.1 hypothetical protein, variant [Exophiala oligosperma]